MSAVIVSLREPGHGRPVAVHAIGDVTVATLASAWGDWGGRAAEEPAVTGAHTSLLVAAQAGETDWPAALLRAFVAAAERIDRLPAQEHTEDGCDPITTLLCAVVTPARVVVAWVGGLAACVIAGRQLVRESAPHTLLRQLREQGHDLATFPAASRDRLAHIFVRVVGSTRRDAPSPELVEWPPLRPGDCLVLTPARTLPALREHLAREPAGGEPWLRAAVAGSPESGHRIGVLIEP